MKDAVTNVSRAVEVLLAQTGTRLVEMPYSNAQTKVVAVGHALIHIQSHHGEEMVWFSPEWAVDLRHMASPRAVRSYVQGSRADSPLGLVEEAEFLAADLPTVVAVCESEGAWRDFLETSDQMFGLRPFVSGLRSLPPPLGEDSAVAEGADVATEQAPLTPWLEVLLGAMSTTLIRHENGPISRATVAAGKARVHLEKSGTRRRLWFVPEWGGDEARPAGSYELLSYVQGRPSDPITTFYDEVATMADNIVTAMNVCEDENSWNEFKSTVRSLPESGATES